MKFKSDALIYVFLSVVLVTGSALVLWHGLRDYEGARVPVNATAENMRHVHAGLLSYVESFRTMPGSLGEAMNTPRGPYLFPEQLLIVSIPAVEGSDPPTSFLYYPCDMDSPPDTIILVTNTGPDKPAYVMTYGGTMEYLEPGQLGEIEKRIQKTYMPTPDF